MRFRGTFRDDGLERLEKAFLPTLERCGKTIQVLLGEEEINFIQTPVNTDGICASVRIQSDVLFHVSSFKIASKHHNLIAFNLELPLLLRVVRSASSNSAESLEVKLTQKSVAVVVAGAETEEVSKPFLNFAARSTIMTLVQDLPISKPYTGAEIDQLIADKQTASLCQFYVDLAPFAQELQAMVDRMKTISDVVTLSLCKNGDLYADVLDVNVQMGVQIKGLLVFPEGVQPSVEVDRSLPVGEQLEQARAAGDAASVELPIKHLIRLLTVNTLSQPSQILCGIGDTQQHVHVMFVYKDPTRADLPYDATVALDFKLPVVQ